MSWLGKLLKEQGGSIARDVRGAIPGDARGSKDRAASGDGRGAKGMAFATIHGAKAPASGGSQDAKGAVPAGVRGRSKPVSNVLMLVDVSYSVGQEALDHVSEEGLRCIVDTLRAHALSNDIVYNFALFAFSATTEEIIGFTSVHELAAHETLPRLSCRSITCMEDALWEAFARIDAEKAAQDAAGTQRAGSLVLMVTDGRPTDGDGKLKPLSALLSEEIVRRNETRETSTFVIGMGDVDDSTLRVVGPPSTESLIDGAHYEAPRAVRYTSDDYRSRQCWEAVCSLVGRASSSSTGTPFVAGSEEDASRLADYADAVILDSSKFRVVR